MVAIVPHRLTQPQVLSGGMEKEAVSQLLRS